ncbi:hypothetical protein AAMO2058_000841700 [Amorphochlora amoebiformis]
MKQDSDPDGLLEALNLKSTKKRSRRPVKISKGRKKWHEERERREEIRQREIAKAYVSGGQPKKRVKEIQRPISREEYKRLCLETLEEFLNQKREEDSAAFEEVEKACIRRRRLLEASGSGDIGLTQEEVRGIQAADREKDKDIETRDEKRRRDLERPERGQKSHKSKHKSKHQHNARERRDRSGLAMEGVE